MSKKNYDEASVVKSLNKKNTININIINKTISVQIDSTEIGNGSWGKIDYLCKVHDYHTCFVNNVSKKVRQVDSEYKPKNNKIARHEAKLNIATMSKNAMKKVSKR